MDNNVKIKFITPPYQKPNEIMYNNVKIKFITSSYQKPNEIKLPYLDTLIQFICFLI